MTSKVEKKATQNDLPSCVFLNGIKATMPKTPKQHATVTSLMNEKFYNIYLPSNPDTDEIAALADGSLTRVAMMPSINGVSWPILADETTWVPKSVYELVLEAGYQPEQLAAKQRVEHEKSRGNQLAFNY